MYLINPLLLGFHRFLYNIFTYIWDMSDCFFLFSWFSTKRRKQSTVLVCLSFSYCCCCWLPKSQCVCKPIESKTRPSRSIAAEWQAGLFYQLNHSLQAQAIQFCASAELQITTCSRPVGFNPSCKLEFCWEVLLNTNIQAPHLLYETRLVQVVSLMCVYIHICIHMCMPLYMGTSVMCMWKCVWDRGAWYPRWCIMELGLRFRIIGAFIFIGIYQM